MEENLMGPLVLEISSDEEAGFGETRKGGEFGAEGGGCDEFNDGEEDYDWLSKLLGEVGGNQGDDDSDDVVVVSEAFLKSPKRSKLETLKLSGKDEEEEDDDCVVLDGDPDKEVVVAKGEGDGGNDDDSDDVEIVGEKGEVACRDFPHARHLCAKFPFASTPHEVHCRQCHCYVCDSLAPCSHWGNGISSIDHCHAIDKDEYWKAERKRMKKGNNPVPAIPCISGTSRVEAFTRIMQIPVMQIPVRPPQQPVFLPQNPVLRPVPNHPCSVSSNVSLPNAVSQGANHPYGRVFPSYRPQSQPVSQSQRACNNGVTARDKSHNAGLRSIQSFPPRAVFKRPGFVGPSPNRKYGYGSQLSRDASLRRCHTFNPPVMNGRQGSNQRNIGNHAGYPLSTTPRLTTPQYGNYLPSQPQIHYNSQSPSLTHNNYVSSVPLPPNVASSQPSVSNSETLNQPQPHPQPHLFQPNSHVPSPTLASYPSDAGNSFQNQPESRPMIYPQSSQGSNFQYQPSQPQVHNNPTSLLADCQNDFQQGDQAQKGADLSPVDYGFAWCTSLGEEVCQPQRAMSGDDSQLQSTTENDHNQSIAPVDNSHQQSVVQADNSFLGNEQFPTSKELDFQFDNWMFENHSFPGSLEVPLSPVWNIFSPEPASTDRYPM